MDDREYRDFLSALFERYIRPRQIHLRREFRHHFDDKFSYFLERTQRAARAARFVEREWVNDEAVFEMFTREWLSRTVQDTGSGIKFANRIMENGGYYDAIGAFGREIVHDLKPRHLPRFDDGILADSGSPDTEIDRRVLVRLAKARLEQELRRKNEILASMRLDDGAEFLAADSSAFEEALNTGDSPKREPPKKPRRWFKGLGQISQGAALSIANVAVSIGAIHMPVSVETRTWGAIVSVVTGLGTIMNGIGDLRGE